MRSVPKVQDRRVIPLVGVLAASFVVFIVMVAFGVNTSCTNAWSCTSSECSHCQVVSIASVGGLVLGGLVSAGAILGPWPRRGRSVIYVVAMIATAVLVLVVAQSWSAPGAQSSENDAVRVLEAIEDARLELRERVAAR
jgi:hypothetical protein